MRSADTGTSSPKHGRRQQTALAATCLVGFGCALALFFFGQTPDRLAQSLKALPADQQGLAYVRHRPFDAVGFLAHGHATVRNSPELDRSGVATLSAALALSPTEPSALRWAAQRELSASSPTRGLEVAATLALVSPVDRHTTFELLRNRIGTPEWRGFFERKIDEAWPLTDAFLQHVCANDKSVQLVASQTLIWEVSSRQPVSPQTLSCVERRLVDGGLTPVAYQLRLGASRNLSRRVDHVYNGGFEMQPSGSPFDWTINRGGEYRDGFVAAIRSGVEFGNSGQVLHVRFSGQPIRGAAAVQSLALEPGKFKLLYRTREVGFTSAKVPLWTVRCATTQQVLTTSVAETADATHGWTTRATAFTIPTDCAGQTLSLEAQTRLSALEGIRGTLVVDDVFISEASTDQ